MLNISDKTLLQNIHTDWSNHYCTFERTYIAVKTEEGWVLSYVLLILNSEIDNNSNNNFYIRTDGIIASRSTITIDEDIIKNIFDIPDTKNYSFIENDVNISFNYGSKADIHFHPDNHPDYPSDRRIPVISLRGRFISNQVYDNNYLDLQLRALDQPFDSINELNQFLGISMNRNISSDLTLYVAFHPPTKIDSDSHIDKDRLRILIKASSSIKNDDIKITINSPSNDYGRFTIPQSSIKFNQCKKWIEVRVDHPMKDTLFAQCFLSYKNEFAHKYWILDKKQQLNDRAGLYRLFDENYSTLNKLINSQYRNSNARDFEIAISILLSLHGFFVIKLGPEKLQDGPDLLAETPDRKLLVIECTTDLPDKNNKLSKLIQRKNLIDKYLSETFHGYMEVLPVLITSLTKNEVVAHKDSAEKHKVSLVCIEDINDAVERLKFPPNPESIYQELKKLIPNTKVDPFSH